MPVAAALGERQTRQAPSYFDLDAARSGLRRKEEVVGQVCRGQLPLLEAAARFRSADRGGWPGTPDVESCCRTVIAWVGLALADRPELAAALTGRLEAELELNLARSGGVRLPDAD
jgi:hypothetical protein